MKTLINAHKKKEHQKLCGGLIIPCWQTNIQCDLRSLRLLSYRILGVAFVYSLMALQSACTFDNDENPSNVLELNLSKFQVCRNSFSIKKLSLTHVDGSTVLFRLTADSVLDRPRTGQMAFFKNYYEIHLHTMVLDQPLKESVARLDLKAIVKAVRSLDDENNESNQGKPFNEAGPDFLGCSLSRVLVDDIRMNFTPTNRSPIILSAGHAKMGTDADIIKFEQNVNLNATKCKLSSQSAVWSNQHNGLFLPVAYIINGKKKGAGDFFKISRQGRCIRVHPTPVVEYLDMLDEVDSELFNHLHLMPDGAVF